MVSKLPFGKYSIPPAGYFLEITTRKIYESGLSEEVHFPQKPKSENGYCTFTLKQLKEELSQTPHREFSKNRFTEIFLQKIFYPPERADPDQISVDFPNRKN